MLCLICGNDNSKDSTLINIKTYTYCSFCINSIQLNIDSNKEYIIKQNNIEIFKFLNLLNYNFDELFYVLTVKYDLDINIIKFLHNIKPYKQSIYDYINHHNYDLLKMSIDNNNIELTTFFTEICNFRTSYDSITLNNECKKYYITKCKDEILKDILIKDNIHLFNAFVKNVNFNDALKMAIKYNCRKIFRHYLNYISENKETLGYTRDILKQIKGNLMFS
jgi:hypothetical protein